MRDAVPGDWDFAFEGLTLALLASALIVTLAVRVIARVFPGVEVPFLARLVPFMPFAVRIHLAVSLIGMLSFGWYLSPAMDLEADVAGILLGAVMVVVAIGMATGWHARAAAWLLVAAGPLGMLEFGVVPVLARVDLLGLAVFIIFTGPGLWSADVEGGRERPEDGAARARAIWALRIAVGAALIVVAFQEKLANPDLALALLQDKPELNVADRIGLPLGNLEFARIAGAIEVLFGLLLISGALSQAAVLIAGVPFNATLWFFGINELVGHLPIYGAMLVLLVFGSHPQLRPTTYGWGGLPRRGRRGTGGAGPGPQREPAPG